ncbi:MAG TPA: J domain-containing protein [Bacteroidia bacterium]|nr:J domain-containing protein [Bacteroidia bacterium]
MDTDCYKLLEISPDADEKTIRKAWRLKTKEVHPDINPSPEAGSQFRELTSAMETLLDPIARLKHDRHFGYYGKPKNKNSNAKQSFSNYQTEKAEVTANEWSKDYEIAMAMREEQRRKHLAKHTKRMKRIIISMIIVLVLLAVLTVLFWDHIFVLP